MLGDIAVSLLQCTEPVPATRQPSTSLSAIPSKDAEGFLHGGGCRCFQASRHPISGMSSLARHYDSSVTLPSRMGAFTPGYRCGFSAQFEPVTLFSLGKIPPVSTGFHLTVVNSAAKAFCLQQELSSLLQKGSNRGSTADGSRTRLSQPLLPRSKEGRRLEAYPGSTAFESFPLQRGSSKCWRWEPSCLRFRRETGLSPSIWRMRIFTSRSLQDTWDSFGFAFGGKGLPIQGSAPSAWLWPPEDIYQMHGCCTGPFEAPGHPCTELSGRLAHSGSLQGASESSQGYRSRPHPFSWPQNERQEECAPPISTNCISRSSFGFRSDAGPFGSCPDTSFYSMFGPLQARHHVSVGTCRRLLGLMAAASPVLPLGLLHMRPFLWWMKELRLHPTVPATRLVRVSRSCCRHLLMWRDPVCLFSGAGWEWVRSTVAIWSRRTHQWQAGAGLRRKAGEWRVEGRVPLWHINCLDLRAVFLALKYFLPLFSGGASCHSQDGQYGGCVPHKTAKEVQGRAPWTGLGAIFSFGLKTSSSLWGRFTFRVVLNLAADFLSRQKLKPGEWMLNRQTVHPQIWDLFGKAEVDLFALKSHPSARSGSP